MCGFRNGILVSVMKNRNIRFALALAVCLGTSAPMYAQTGATSAPFWTGMKDAASFERAMDGGSRMRRPRSTGWSH